MTNILVKRLMVIYGEPDSINPDAYLAEIENLTSGFGGDVLKEAADDVISTHRFKTWPTPAQCIQACHMVAERHATAKPARFYRFQSKRGPYAPETLESWRLAAEWRASLPAHHPLVRQGGELAVKFKDVTREAFRQMQQESRNRELHARPLTDRSRAMMGDTER